MSLENELKKGITNHLKRENKKIVRYNEDYSFANKHYNTNILNEEIEKVNEALKHDEILRNKIIINLKNNLTNQENKEIKGKFSGKDLNIELIVNDNKEIYLPINVKKRSLLEEDVLDYIGSLTRNIDKNVEQGNLEDFVSFSLNNANNLIFNEVPEIFNLTNIMFNKNKIIVPINDTYRKIEKVLEESVSFPSTEEDVRHIRMTPHSKRKKYIPLRKNENTPDFFPKLNMPFIIQYGNGEYFATLSSRNEIHNTNDDLGSMKKMFEDMNISEDSILKVTNLDSEVYSVELLNNDNNPVSSPVDNLVSSPVEGNDSGVSDIRYIRFNHSAIDHHHIPFRKKDGPKDFIPPYKIPFTIEYLNHSFIARVTSRYGKNNSGSYIRNHTDNPGEIEKMIKELGLKEGSFIKMIRENPEKYRVELSDFVEAGQPNFRDIILTPACIDSNYIPQRAEHQDFFPNSGVSFSFEYNNNNNNNINSFIAHEDPLNKWIIRNTGDESYGAMGKMYNCLNITGNSNIRVTEIEPKERYHIRKSRERKPN